MSPPPRIIDSSDLPPIADYFPPADGRYHVRPDLHPLGHDFGNGAADRRVLQLDRAYPLYRRQKNAALRESAEKYRCRDDLDDRLSGILCAHLLRQMTGEYPDIFLLEQDGHELRLHCRHSGDALFLDADYRLQALIPGPFGAPPCDDTLDALALQLQEDLAVVVIDEHGDRIRWLHLCFPNRWAAADKIGADFIGAHAPVPGMGSINARAAQLLQAMVHKGPFVRFAWGITSSPALNLHPDGGPAIAAVSSTGPWFLRTERQTITGLPAAGASLFTIRTYIRGLRELCADRRRAELLAEALATMPAASAAYKGLAGLRPDILRWLHQ